MQKTLIGVLAVVVAAGIIMGVWGVMRGTQENGLSSGENGLPGGEDIVSNPLIVTFQQELSKRALARGPHPVEGFDAQMLLDTFPGFEPTDFDGVPTGAFGEEGRHFYRNDELQWSRTGSRSMTSAEHTVTQAGYGILLENVSARLDMPTATTQQVLAIVDAVDIPSNIAEHIASKSDLIVVYTPKPLATVTSPLTVYGQARGTWFFEATFPVTLTDWDGRIIAESYASAVLNPNDPESTWMTEEFVPFEGVLEFENPSFPNTDASHFSHRGTLILHKSNPSGLSEHDDALEISVVFPE